MLINVWVALSLRGLSAVCCVLKEHAQRHGSYGGKGPPPGPKGRGVSNFWREGPGGGGPVGLREWGGRAGGGGWEGGGGGGGNELRGEIFLKGAFRGGVLKVL